ncbi:hypothetical protein AAFF_G00196450 [Aldrovandia affinis]|uniref:Uromodulin n=1 Tax=Aldrovandia affinis TaxID=143900 RepID=A0AAD7RIR1_9TELE|nr:hypothetical protein AAFF_G00196450 [Aldrovandia affinis]
MYAPDPVKASGKVFTVAGPAVLFITNQLSQPKRKMWRKEDVELLMGARLLAFLLLVPVIYAESPGVTSCEACHKDSTCRVSPDPGGAVELATFICSCRDGYAGDGLSCHSRAACDSGPPCCRPGHQWSSERGCVDVDECSLPGEPCSPPHTCENTPGSYHCLVPASGGRSDSFSVGFYCGGQQCPWGEDCLSIGNTFRCLDPCKHYTVLDDAWRATNNTDNVNTIVCGTCGQDETCVSEDKITWRCEKQELTPELVCGRSLLQVGFLRAQLEASGLNVTSAHMADSNCTGHLEKDGKVWFPVERKEGSCGTQLETNGTHAVYSNSVILEGTLLRDVTFSSRVAFPFSCAYPLDLKTSLDLAIRPIKITVEVEVSGTGSRAKATMSLYRNNNYTDPYSMGEVTLPLGSTLYVGVFVEEVESDRFVVVMEDCHATPTADPEAPVRFYLIQNTCPSDSSLVTVEESGESLEGRFSTLLFRFVSDYDSVFLHCSLRVCDQREDSCSQSCPGGKSRSMSHSRPLTIGPIYRDPKFTDQKSSASTGTAASWILNSLLVPISVFYLL